jgi:hypothetical protein
MMIETMENCEEGIVVGGQVVGDLKFADDQGMVSNSEDGFQRLMDQLNDTANSFNMKIYLQKTKTIVVSRDRRVVVDITIDGQRVEPVKNFKYLRSIISEDG